MSRWFPQSFSRGCWSDDLTSWHVIVAGGREIGTIWIKRDSSFGTAGDLGILIFKVVGTARFELTTSCSQSRRSTKLSYVP
jgi:hypothetical protein